MRKLLLAVSAFTAYLCAALGAGFVDAFVGMGTKVVALSLE